jgi:acyl-CoA thioesterase-1
MTEPRWAAGSKNGLGESPNDRLEKYMTVCREVAKEKQTRLIDHFARWSKAENPRVNIRDWTTDGCHPNPRGHREIAELIWPVLTEVLKN